MWTFSGRRPSYEPTWVLLRCKTWSIILHMKLLLVLAGSLAFAQSSDYQLFLLIGQSNMAGRGKIEAQDREPIPRVLMLNKELEWVPAVDPVHFDKPDIVGVGIARTFGRVLANANPSATIGLIPAAVGGTSLHGMETWRQAIHGCHPAGAGRDEIRKTARRSCGIRARATAPRRWRLPTANGSRSSWPGCAPIWMRPTCRYWSASWANTSSARCPHRERTAGAIIPLRPHSDRHRGRAWCIRVTKCISTRPPRASSDGVTPSHLWRSIPLGRLEVYAS